MNNRYDVFTHIFIDDMILQVTGAEWPLAKQAVSPCPTLKVIKFVTDILDKKEKLKSKPPRSVVEALERLVLN